MPQHTAVPVVSSPSASPRSWPSLTVFGGCQGIFPALTTPKNCGTTMRDGGDAEAVSVPRNPNIDRQADKSQTKAHSYKPNTRLTQFNCRIMKLSAAPSSVGLICVTPDSGSTVCSRPAASSADDSRNV